MPTSDQVPALTNTESWWPNGTAATAEPVSCVATAITVAPSGAPGSPVSSGPSRVPDGTTSGKRSAGISSRSSRSRAQVAAYGSKHCVVVALVSSVDRLPQSREWTRSGISRSVSASASAGSFSATSAESSKTVLIGSSWMPVRW